MLKVFLFTKIEEEDIGKTFGFNRTALRETHPKLHSMFCSLFLKIALSISHRADIVWLPRSCDLTPLDYYLWCAVKDKCYTDKPEIIDALKDNIREVDGEIQPHANDNVLKNWTDRVGYCMASRGSHLSEIIFHY